MPTLVWNEDFESGTIASIFNTSGGAPTLDTAVFRTGAQSFKASGNPSYGQKSVTASAIFVFRCYFRLASIPAQGIEFITFGTPPNGVRFGYDQTANKLGLILGTSQTCSPLSTVTPVAGRWYRLDLRLDMSANPFVIDWMIDGVAQTQATNPLAASTGNTIYLGHTTGFSVAVTVNFDSVALSQTAADYPLGPPAQPADTGLAFTGDTLAPKATRFIKQDSGLSPTDTPPALNFDGATSYGLVADAVGNRIDTNNAFSYVGWVYLDSYNNNLLIRMWEKNPHYLCVMGDPTNSRYRKIGLEVQNA